ncbi:Vacuolar protein-sorting-associated protein 36, partial [Coemansia sp. RSA 2704]
MEAADLAPTLRPLLAAGEKIAYVQNKIGLYRGTIRDEEHDNGTVYLTTRRIIYVDQHRPWDRSVALQLSLVERCSLHSGFLYSSGKIHLYLRPSAGESTAGDLAVSSPASVLEPGTSHLLDGTTTATDPGAAAPEWQCGICEHVNRGRSKCALCGVPRPENASEFGSALGSNPALPGGSEQVRCPVCTFDNHASISNCEMCDSKLLPAAPVQPASADTASPSPADRRGSGDGGSGGTVMIKLSFRAGGSSQFHSALKEALGAAAWAASNPANPGDAQNALQPSAAASLAPRDRRPTAGGISTIVSTAHETERARDVTLHSAFADLD